MYFMTLYYDMQNEYLNDIKNFDNKKYLLLMLTILRNLHLKTSRAEHENKFEHRDNYKQLISSTGPNWNHNELGYLAGTATDQAAKKIKQQ